jgi:hypothetical protein
LKIQETQLLLKKKMNFIMRIHKNDNTSKDFLTMIERLLKINEWQTLVKVEQLNELIKEKKKEKMK